MEQQTQKPQQGSGSAENKGEARQAQHSVTHVDHEERRDIRKDIQPGNNRIGDISETGQLSGRDDYAGGSGDDMSEQSTGEPTER